MDESALRTLIANLEASRSSDHWWLEFCTALVAVGVLFEVIFVIWEYVDELHDFRSGIVHPPERPNILLFSLGLLGAGLVAIGVAGEFRFESKIESTETHIRKANDDLFLLLSKEAGDAAVSAKTAHDEADAVTKETDELTVRLENASRQLGQIEHRVLVQGPRWRSLENGKTAFIEALKPFTGQQVTVVICGSISGPEEFRLEQDLINFFKTARWASPGYMRWPQCNSSFAGFTVLWNSAAGEEVKKSAGVLYDSLTSLSLFATGDTTEPGPRGQMDVHAFGTDSPYAKVLNEPTTVFLIIGSNPMLEHSDVFGGKKTRSKTRTPAK